MTMRKQMAEREKAEFSGLETVAQIATIAIGIAETPRAVRVVTNVVDAIRKTK